jgi:hypothetical protein
LRRMLKILKPAIFQTSLSFTMVSTKSLQLSKPANRIVCLTNIIVSRNSIKGWPPWCRGPCGDYAVLALCLAFRVRCLVIFQSLRAMRSSL